MFHLHSAGWHQAVINAAWFIGCVTVLLVFIELLIKAEDTAEWEEDNKENHSHGGRK